MKIIPYERKYKNDFIKLNTAWVEKYFQMEKADLDVLEHVEDLLESGSMIFFALEGDMVLATCMAMPLDKDNDIWEICKLAATGQYTGKGAGSAVFKASIDYAIANGAKKLTLISNRRLHPALHIYRKFGFHEVPLDKAYWGFERADIQFELDTMTDCEEAYKKENAKKNI